MGLFLPLSSVSCQRVWLDTGTAEGENPARVVADARLLRARLAAKGSAPHYEKAQGNAHNEQSWGKRFGRVRDIARTRAGGVRRGARGADRVCGSDAGDGRGQG